eukprot:TRINITY_DN9153_c0_g1_i7.p1 TRINITY_DN9153_c0_g1~~TRINITY_DN9153_c0_g1_i7.p1  ORF type:complete len:2765 (+),score=231.52 TRINITY_DN9153_c0_g1_i7:756-8297(+)
MQPENSIHCFTCSDGFYGSQCQQCNCSGHGLCSTTFGCICTASDADGYWFPNSSRAVLGVAPCSTCLSNFTISSSCRQPDSIDCNSRTCSGHGTCNTTASPFITSAKCSCYDDDARGHWRGVRCGSCQTGWYGTSCTTKCTSTTCVHGTCDAMGKCVCFQSSQLGFWDGETCEVCATRFQGTECKACAHGWWHQPTCVQECPGGWRTPCSAHGECSPIDGTCTCLQDVALGYWADSDCSVCGVPSVDGAALVPDGQTSSPFYGSDCATYCSSVTCNNRGNCDASTGMCVASSNISALWTGRFLADCSANSALGYSAVQVVQNFTVCSACATYWYRDIAQHCTIYCNPLETCGGHGTCASDGSCQCYGRGDLGFWEGTNCERCRSEFVHPSTGCATLVSLYTQCGISVQTYRLTADLSFAAPTLVFMFGGVTDRAASLAIYSSLCSMYFSGTSLQMLGKNATCEWLDDLTLRIALGQGYTVATGSKLYIDGSVVAAAIPKYALTTNTSACGRRIARSSLEFVAPALPLTLTAVLSAIPTTPTKYEGVVLVAMASSGIGPTFKFGGSNLPTSLTRFLEANAAGGTVRIPAEMLPNGTSSFKVTVNDGLGQTVVATVQVVKGTSTPTLQYYGPLDQTVYETQEVAIGVKVVDGTTDLTAASFSWSITPFPDGMSTDLLSRSGATLVIPPNTLQSGKTYALAVSATTSTATTPQLQFTLRVPSKALTVTILGGTYRRIGGGGGGGVVPLAATVSNNNTNVNYFWQCKCRQPGVDLYDNTYSGTCAVTTFSGALTTPTLSLPYSLQWSYPGFDPVCKFFVTVTEVSSSKTATASQLIELLVNDTLPAVSITGAKQVSNTQRIRLEACVTDTKGACIDLTDTAVKWKWSCSSHPNLNLNDMSRFPLGLTTSQFVAVPPFSPGATYQFSVQAVLAGTNRSGLATFQVVIAVPPVNLVLPSVSDGAKFLLAGTWTPAIGLRYSLLAVTEGGKHLQLGLESPSPLLPIPAWLTSRLRPGEGVLLTVIVRDLDDGVSSASLKLANLDTTTPVIPAVVTPQLSEISTNYTRLRALGYWPAALDLAWQAAVVFRDLTSGGLAEANETAAAAAILENILLYLPNYSTDLLSVADILVTVSPTMFSQSFVSNLATAVHSLVLEMIQKQYRPSQRLYPALLTSVFRSLPYLPGSRLTYSLLETLSTLPIPLAIAALTPGSILSESRTFSFLGAEHGCANLTSATAGSHSLLLPNSQVSVRVHAAVAFLCAANWGVRPVPAQLADDGISATGAVTIASSSVASPYIATNVGPVEACFALPLDNSSICRSLSVPCRATCVQWEPSKRSFTRSCGTPFRDSAGRWCCKCDSPGTLSLVLVPVPPNYLAPDSPNVFFMYVFIGLLVTFVCVVLTLRFHCPAALQFRRSKSVYPASPMTFVRRGTSAFSGGSTEDRVEYVTTLVARRRLRAGQALTLAQRYVQHLLADHPWLGVFGYEPTSTITRMQRITLLWCLIALGLLVNCALSSKDTSAARVISKAILRAVVLSVTQPVLTAVIMFIPRALRTHTARNADQYATAEMEANEVIDEDADEAHTQRPTVPDSMVFDAEELDHVIDGELSQNRVLTAVTLDWVRNAANLAGRSPIKRSPGVPSAMWHLHVGLDGSKSTVNTETGTVSAVPRPGSTYPPVPWGKLLPLDPLPPHWRPHSASKESLTHVLAALKDTEKWLSEKKAAFEKEWCVFPLPASTGSTSSNQTESFYFYHKPSDMVHRAPPALLTELGKGAEVYRATVDRIRPKGRAIAPLEKATVIPAAKPTPTKTLQLQVPAKSSVRLSPRVNEAKLSKVEKRRVSLAKLETFDFEFAGEYGEDESSVPLNDAMERVRERFTTTAAAKSPMAGNRSYFGSIHASPSLKALSRALTTPLRGSATGSWSTHVSAVVQKFETYDAAISSNTHDTLWMLGMEAVMMQECQLAGILFDLSLIVQNPDLWFIFHPTPPPSDLTALITVVMANINSPGRGWALYYSVLHLKITAEEYPQLLATSQNVSPQEVIAIAHLWTPDIPRWPGRVPYYMELEDRIQDGLLHCANRWQAAVEHVQYGRPLLGAHMFRYCDIPASVGERREEGETVQEADDDPVKRVPYARPHTLTHHYLDQFPHEMKHFWGVHRVVGKTIEYGMLMSWFYATRVFSHSGVEWCRLVGDGVRDLLKETQKIVTAGSRDPRLLKQAPVALNSVVAHARNEFLVYLLNHRMQLSGGLFVAPFPVTDRRFPTPFFHLMRKCRSLGMRYGSGTLLNPFYGVHNCLRVARMGDRVMLLPGEYRPTLIRNIKAAPGRTVVLTSLCPPTADSPKGSLTAACFRELRGTKKRPAVLLTIEQCEHLIVAGLSFCDARVGIRSRDSQFLQLRQNRFEMVSVPFDVEGTDREHSSEAQNYVVSKPSLSLGGWILHSLRYPSLSMAWAKPWYLLCAAWFCLAGVVTIEISLDFDTDRAATALGYFAFTVLVDALAVVPATNLASSAWHTSQLPSTKSELELLH